MFLFIVFVLLPKGLPLLFLTDTLETKRLPDRRIQLSSSTFFIWLLQIPPLFMVPGCSFWLPQQLPSAGPKPRRLEYTKKKYFSSFLLPTSPKSPVPTSLRLDKLLAPPLALPRCSCSQEPVIAWLPRPHRCDIPHISDYKMTPDIIISPLNFPQHSDPSWVLSQPGRLVELLEGQR